MYDSLLYLDVNRIAAERCRRPGGLAFFIKEFWDSVIPNPLVWNWHMDVLAAEIQTSDERVFKREKKLHDLIINVPPGTSKTAIVSVFSTAWEFAMMPSIKVFVGSYSDAAVQGIADQIRTIMKSEKYEQMFPETVIRKDRDSLHNFKTVANGEFYAFTVGGTLTSKHADILKVDDPLNPKQASSPKELENANSFFDKTLPTRKVDKEVTPTYLIMQRLAQNDPTGHLLQKKKTGIRHICLPATLSKHVSPREYQQYYINGYMDPVRLGPEALADLKIDLGSYSYAGQIDQTPVPDGGLVWQRKWFREVPDELFPSIKKAKEVATDWDTAFTDDEKNAASAYIKSGIVSNNIYIFDFDWQWFEFPELIKWMKKVGGPHYIEAKASGKSAKQTLSQQGVIAIEVKLKGGSDKVARARAASPTAESGIVYIKKSMADRFFEDSKQGISFFPKGEFKDLADALSQMLQRRAKHGRLVVGESPPENDYDSDTGLFSPSTPEPIPENPLDWI